MGKFIGILIVGVLLGVWQTGSASPLEDGEAAFKRGDYAAALKLWRPLAEEGNARAQYDLGEMYLSGTGVARDDTEALRWHRLSGAQGDASAQSRVGMIYHSGRGVARDDKEALKWYLLAAEKEGRASDQYRLGQIYTMRAVQDYKEAVRWYRLAAAQEGMWSMLAQTALGTLYSLGNNPLGAGAVLGYTGIARDYKEAMRWYRLAAEQGDPGSQLTLGTMYREGRGVAQDYVRAHMWTNLAAASFVDADYMKNASDRRNELAAKMTPAQIERAQEMARKCEQSKFKDCGW